MSVAQDCVEIVRANAEIARLNTLVEKLVNMPGEYAHFFETHESKPSEKDCIPLVIVALRGVGDLMKVAAQKHPTDTGRVK